MGKQLKRRIAPPLSKEEWRKHWPHIKALWDANMKVELINSHMWHTYGFEATTKQYKDQFERKGLRKNLSKEELKALYAYDLGRKQLGKKSTRYRARKKIITPRQLSRHAKEWGNVEPSFQKPRSRRCPDADDKTLTYLECSTSQYDLDNPHMPQLIQGPIEPYHDLTTSSQTANSDFFTHESWDSILSRNQIHREQLIAPLDASMDLSVPSNVSTESVQSVLSRYDLPSERNVTPGIAVKHISGMSADPAYDDLSICQSSAIGLPELIGTAQNGFGQTLESLESMLALPAGNEVPLSALLWSPGTELNGGFVYNGGQSFGPASSEVVPEPVSALPGALLEAANGDGFGWDGGWL